MPLDTRIPLMSQAAPVNIAPGINALLGIQNMRQQQERAPIQNRLLETQIAGAKQTQQGNDRELQLKAAQFQNQAFRALKSIPDPDLRKMAYASFVEHGKQIGIHDGVPDDDISDQGLDAGIAATQGFMSQESGLSEYQRQNLDLQRRRLDVAESLTPAQLANIQIQQQRLAQQSPDFQGSVAGAKEGAKLDVQSRMLPQIKADIEKAKSEVKAAVEKRIKEQGQMGKLEDADRIYQSLSSADLSQIYGRGESLYPNLMRSQSGIDMVANRDQMVGMLELAAAGEMKGQGQITESERKILKDAATTLNNPDISPEMARASLDRAMAIIYRNAGQKFTPPSQQQGGGATKVGRFEIIQDDAAEFEFDPQTGKLVPR